jgi:superfamily II DNA helicase RecQ
MLLLILPSIGIIVVILPLISLKHNIMRRLNYIGLRYKVWEYTEDKEVRYPLVFVLVNKAVSPIFYLYVNQLKARNRLNRVIFDKSHLVITVS